MSAKASIFSTILSTKLVAVNKSLDSFTSSLARETANEERYTRAAVQSYLSLLSRGGKRLRGILTLVGYELYGGDNTKAIAQAAAAIEACHAYLLVMDDVADNSDRRRNGPAAHIDMSAFIAQHNAPASQDADKKGIDMAQTAALYAQHMAQSMFLRLELPDERKIRAAAILNLGLARTGIGQLRDISPLGYIDLTHTAILQIAIYKTAYYSFLLPLQVGAVLAGAPEAELIAFESYSLNAGLAFQLHDDIIGTFGDEKITGKPRMSDIIEGKKTMLMAAALKKASSRDKKILLAALGNISLQNEQFEQCLSIIRRSGALDQTRQLASHYAKQAVAALNKAPAHWEPFTLQFLRDLALYSTERDR